MERDFMQWVIDVRSPVVPAARWITVMGSSAVLAVVVAVLALWALRHQMPRRAVAIALGGLLTTGLARLLKASLDRPRPPRSWWIDDIFGSVPHDYSFPSAHAAHAAFMAAVVVLWWPRRAPVWIGALVLAVAVGASRVVLGVHWPTDVVAGWIVGIAVAAATHHFSRHRAIT